MKGGKILMNQRQLHSPGAVPKELDLDRLISFRYRARVGNDNAARLKGRGEILQLSLSGFCLPKPKLVRLKGTH